MGNELVQLADLTCINFCDRRIVRSPPSPGPYLQCKLFLKRITIARTIPDRARYFDATGYAYIRLLQLKRPLRITFCQILIKKHCSSFKRSYMMFICLTWALVSCRTRT